MLFQDIIGQQDVKEQLVQLVQLNRLSHALLFLGKEGSGALPLALAFSQYIACSNPNETDACGDCPGCMKASKLIHPDIHYSYPVIAAKPADKPMSSDFIGLWREFISSHPYGNCYDWLQFINAENKQGNIPTKECEDINRKLSLKSFEGKYKILIMWMPELLGREGNKLLKLIEEPPEDTLLIFVAEDENGILPTILSRTQLIKVPPLNNSDVEQALISRAGEKADKARQISAVSEGNYREALLLLQHAEEDWLGLLRDWLNSILKTGPAAQVKWIDEMSKLGREKQKQFLRYFIHLLEQAIRLNVIEDNGGAGSRESVLNIPERELDLANRLNKITSLGAQEAIIDELDKACYYIERNANPKMLFHALSIRLYHIIKDNSLILIN